jgi:hypothetical protein
MIGHRNGFLETFGFIIYTSWSYRVYITPITFRLRMDRRVSVYLARGCLEYFYFKPLSQAEHVYCSMNSGLYGLNRIDLIVDRRSRAGEVVNLVDLNVDRETDIVTLNLKIGVI